MYNAYITRIKNIRKHSNADRLQLGECFGNTVVVDLSTVEEQLGIYFPTDGKLGEEYAIKNNLVRKKDENGENIGGYLDPDKRNIRAIKLRGEKSDGLFMPLESLSEFTDITSLKDGDPITTLNGILICEKYIPRTNVRKDGQNTKTKKQFKDSYPLFKEHLDTGQLMYNLKDFKEGDLCYITLKMHGTSQRTSYTLKQKNPKIPSILYPILKHFIKPKKSWELVSGTRRVILRNYLNGYHGSDEFRKKWHDNFEGKLQKGETVYYEVVGHTTEGNLIMQSCNNKKVQDKEFVKKYGDETRFTYGCNEKESDMYVYRMTLATEDGYEIEYPWHLVKLRCEQMGVKHTPELDKFIYTTEEDLLNRVSLYEDGVDPIGKTHIREGIVVRIDNKEKFKALKHKNFYFKVLEGIIKDDGFIDIEEVQQDGSSETC